MTQPVEWYRWLGNGDGRPDIEFSVETFEDGGAIMRTKTIEGMSAPRVTIAPELAGMVEVKAGRQEVSRVNLVVPIRTSDEWHQEDLGTAKGIYEILDPDGWDRSGAGWHYSWFEERISRKEYERRLGQSTLAAKAPGQRRMRAMGP